MSGSVVREGREQDGRSAVGEVALAEGAEPTIGDERAAAARAWLAIADACLDDEDAEAAHRAASRGLEELGEAYLGGEVEDDSTLKLLAAEDAHDAGASHAGTAMVRVLSDRIAMYVSAQDGRVVA